MIPNIQQITPTVIYAWPKNGFFPPITEIEDITTLLVPENKDVSNRSTMSICQVAATSFSVGF